MTNFGMDESTRRDVRELLSEIFGITAAWRPVSLDPTEEFILLSEEDFARVDEDVVTQAIRGILPGVKACVLPNSPEWDAEPL